MEQIEKDIEDIMSDEIMHGLTEVQCGLLTILYNFGDQDLSFFKRDSIQKIIDLGYASFNIKTQIVSISDKGKAIGDEVTMYKLNKIRLV